MGRDRFKTGLNFEETMTAIVNYKPKKEKEETEEQKPVLKPLSALITPKQMEEIIEKLENRKDS